MHKFKTFIIEGAETQSKSCDCDLDENFMDALVSVFTDELNEKRLRREGEISKNKMGSMGTRPATESPSGEMAKEYSRQKFYDRKKPGGGDAKERYKSAKKAVTRTSTQSETGRSPKVMKSTNRTKDAIMRDVKSYKGKNWSGD
jgi:hypothetical protein|tara:strand:+ start:1035 stop:1466 length:432 start_codon:yes stop_codon:yes gene_type:complete